MPVLFDDAGMSRCLDAFAVILAHAFEGGEETHETGRVVSTLDLQLVSLELCTLCRSVPALLVRVDRDTPRRLWSPVDGAALQQRRTRGARARAHGSRRVPTLLPWGVRWMLPGVVPTLSPCEPELPERLRGLRLVVSRATGRSGSVAGGARMQLVSWPASLRRLHFDINRPVAGVVWPASICSLVFGHDFNQPVAEMAWPASLRRLSFGNFFDQPIDGVAWPASLQELSFGGCFDQPIAGVFWPSSLKHLSFGWAFNRPITGVFWPSSLRDLAFGNEFDQPITGVVWPASLQQLSFGRCFNKSIARAVFPASLQQLSFGERFNQPIVEVAWPKCLQQLTVGRDFNQRTVGIEWPASLRRMSRQRTNRQ